MTHGTDPRSRRRRRLIVAAMTGLVVVVAGGRLAAAGSLLGLEPDEGPPGTPYKVTVTCADEPTVYGRPLDDDPPATQVPLEVGRGGPTEWTIDAVAGGYDDVYSAECGGDFVRARFDADAPRLFFGPVPNHGPVPLDAQTQVEGTDCPAGTSASVTITADRSTVAHTAAINRYGDWAVDLPSPIGTQDLRVEATCGDVRYKPLTLAAFERPTIPPSAPPATAAPPVTPTPELAPPAEALPGPPSFTG